LIDEATGNVDYLRDEVNKIEKLYISGRKTREEVASIVVLYNEERDRLERYVTDAIRIRLEERQKEIDAATALVIATLVKSIVDGLGLKGEQRQQALVMAAGQLSLAGASQDDEAWKGPFQEAARMPAPPALYNKDLMGVGSQKTSAVADVIDVESRAVG
jgi:hypothetical protein